MLTLPLVLGPITQIARLFSHKDRPVHHPISPFSCPSNRSVFRSNSLRLRPPPAGISLRTRFHVHFTANSHHPAADHNCCSVPGASPSRTGRSRVLTLDVAPDRVHPRATAADLRDEHLELGAEGDYRQLAKRLSVLDGGPVARPGRSREE
jgi:hypothetical protein